MEPQTEKEYEYFWQAQDHTQEPFGDELGPNC